MRIDRISTRCLAATAAVLLVACALAFTSRPDDEWSYSRVTRPDTPAVRNAGWVRNPIDAFVLARLEAAGLEPAPEADRRTLIRRATYDLTGLPPTPKEVEAFAADDSPDAYERLVERLLASPQYGVKWGRHWLDLVRYAETDGYERDRVKPGAWRYRDYVIDSFNADKPYDRFIIEQLAGDEIESPTFETMVATGYYHLGIRDDEPTDVLLAQHDDLDGMLDTTARVMLAVSMGCVRCHDHKRDPIPQADYYRMLAFFKGIKPYKVGGGNSPNPENYTRSIPLDYGSSDFEREMEAYRTQRAELVAALARFGAIDLTAEQSQRLASRAEHGRVALYDFALADDLAADARAVHNGRTSGDPAPVAWSGGVAVRLDGQDDHLTIPRSIRDDFTISFFFRTSQPGAGGSDTRWWLGSGLVDAEVRGVLPDFGVAINGEGRVLAGAGDPETFIHSGPGYHDNEWHHVALTRHRASGLLRLFVDGELVAEAEGSTAALDAADSIDIGRSHAGGRHFMGEIAAVALYDITLTDREVLALAVGETCGEAFESIFAESADAKALDEYRALVEQLSALRRPQQEMATILCVQEEGPVAPETYVFARGNPHAPGEAVVPGVPGVFGFPELPAISPGESSSGRRLALARWIASPENPRTARVMANRIWQFHFGRGIVASANDFGRLGDAPTHPDLLDWLAAEFVERGWSVKAMHRLIMTSSTYRMSSRPSPRALELDPTNALWSRFDLRRLQAEEIRDSILAVNGTLNLEMGGPSVYPPMPPAVLATSSTPDQAWGRSPPDQAARRSAYIHVKRSLLHPFLTSFDLADTDMSCPARFTTTQPTQALTMMNGEFIAGEAEALARRLRQEHADAPSQVRRGLQLVFQREPEPVEVEEGLSLIETLVREHGLTPERALDRFCLVILNTNEFVYVD